MGTRDTTGETIVAAATKLLLERGISAVAMEDIARASGCTRRTLYRYWETKEGLVYEVIIRLLETWNEDQQKTFDMTSGSGLTRFGSFLNALVDRVNDRRDTLRLMGEFDFVFRDDLGYSPGPATAERFARTAGLTEELMTTLVRAGIIDGSVRADVDVAIIVPTISVALWAGAQRVAIRDHMIVEEFGFSGASLLRAQIDLYLRALAA